MKKVSALFAAVFILVFAGTCTASEVQASFLGENVDDDTLTYYGFFETIAEMEEAKELGGFKIPGTKRKIALVINGVVICRFDTTKAEFRVDEEAKTIHARLPHAEVFKVITDFQNIRAYDQKTGLFAPEFTFSEQTQLLKNVLDDIPQKAKKDWKMLDKAEDNARKGIVMLAKELGFKAKVEFSDEAAAEAEQEDKK